MLVAVLVLCAVGACLFALLATGSSWSATALLVASAAWFPANNHQLEGPILVRVSLTHGVTLADLIGLAGFVVSSAVLAAHAVRAAPVGERAARGLIVFSLCCVTLAAGAGAAFANGS